MDQTPPEQPSREPSDGLESGIFSEQEVADVLAEASKLAGELARQLDGEEATPAPAVTATLTPESPKVDEQLDDVDALLAITSNELSETPTPAEESAEPRRELTPEEVAQAVPGFMDEFTPPENESDDATGSGEGSSTGTAADTQFVRETQVGPKPGVVGTSLVGVATGETPEPQLVAEGEPVVVAPRRRVPNLREPFAKLVRLVMPAVPRILARLFPVADRVVGVLEKTDRPFTWMKEPVRCMIGWLAIATLGTSVFVFFWSLI